MDITEDSVKIIKKKKGKRNRKKGFSDEQIRLLETMFECETKPEPKKKVELAAELGLQPRQVAIWFQNRRARWKSKRIEQDYNVLRGSYDSLMARYEELKKEHNDLQMELQKLTAMLGRSPERSRICAQNDNLVYEGTSQYSVKESCPEKTPANNGSPMENGFELLNLEEDMEEQEEEEDGSLGTLNSRWCDFGSNSSSDYTLSSMPWSNFWT